LSFLRPSDSAPLSVPRTLGNIYGEGARSAITSLTLFAGFASNYLLALERLFR
jgi:hypothetical protein